MRRIIIILVFTSFVFSSGAQCPDLGGEPLYLNTQEEVDRFLENWPDCRDFQGELIIGRTRNGTPGTVRSLDGLKNLRTITGSLKIMGNLYLSGLEGLDSLTTVTGKLEIEGNYELDNLTAVRNVDCGGFGLTKCPKLETFDFEGHTESIRIEGPVGFRNLAIEADRGVLDLQLFNIDTLDQMALGEGKYGLWISNCGIKQLVEQGSGPDSIIHLSIFSCPDLEEIEILKGIDEVRDGITLDGLAVRDLSFLSDVYSTTVMVIRSCRNLRTFDQLASLEVTGLLNIYDNPQLISIDSLEYTLTRTDILNIRGNGELRTCDVLCDRLRMSGMVTNVEMNGPGCSDLAEIREMCISSVKDEMKDIKVYRRNEVIHIEGLDQKVLLEIFDTHGRLITSQDLNPGEHRIPVPGHVRVLLRLVGATSSMSYRL